MRQAIKKKTNNNKYQRILTAGIKTFARLGFDKSTIAQIASEAEVADGTIYLYFKNKNDILVHFYKYKTTQVFERFREEVDRAENSVDKLTNLINRHLKEFQADRDMAIVYLAETHQKIRHSFVEDQIKQMSKMYQDIISEIVEQGQEEGTIRRDLYLGLVRRFIIGSVDEVINTWIHSDGKYDLVTMADPLVDLFIKGIGIKM